MSSPARLNWGCGLHPAAGWVNSDIVNAPGVDIVCDLRRGLPIPDDTFEYIVSIHALQDLPYLDIPAGLRELRRVLRADGVLRLGLPDLDRGIRAYVAGDTGYFCVPDHDASTLSGKLITQIIWYGSTRTPFTVDFAVECLRRAGFRAVTCCAYRRTASRYPEIVALDNRELESFFVEATK
jgi:SAM-dependent methyltransferase